MKKIIVNLGLKKIFGKDEAPTFMSKNDPKKDWKFCYHCQVRVADPCDTNSKALDCERF